MTGGASWTPTSAVAPLALAIALSGCGMFVAPHPAKAPLKGSLAAEALWAGPLSGQPKELPTVASPCELTPSRGAKSELRFGIGQESVHLGAITFVTPLTTGAKLRAPWIRWTHLYALWDRVANEERVGELFTANEQIFWSGTAYTPVLDAFAKLNQRTCGEALTDQITLEKELELKTHDLLVRRIRALVEKRAASGADKSSLEEQIRGHLEVLAATSQRANERVKKLDILARQEAQLYSTLAESARTLLGLQRNITNHLLHVDLVLSADEAKALAEATKEKLTRIRGAIDAGRQAELDAQKTATTPEWMETLRKALDAIRPQRKE